MNRLTVRIGVGVVSVSWGEAARKGTQRSSVGSLKGIPEVPIDYGSLASQGGVGATIMVARERHSRMACAAMVRRKGKWSPAWSTPRRRTSMER